MRFFRQLLAGSFLAAALFWAGPAEAGAAEGKKVFEANRCSGCHQVNGPASEKTIKDQLARKGPELWYAGSKFREGFLERWLSNPQPIRPLEYNSVTARNRGDHPRLSPGDASEVASYLMSLTSPEARAAGIRPSDNPKGRILFVKKQSCYGCHTVLVRGKVAGGLSGPTFIGASARLNPDWIYAYLRNPKAFKPVKMMPVYAGILDDAEMKALASYVGSLN